MNDKLKRAIEVIESEIEWRFDDAGVREDWNIIKAELDQKSYTPAEMEAFAEWTAIMQWIYDPTDKCWFQKHSTETKITAQLREMWEEGRTK